jgi:hypothetical protein
VLQGQQSWQHAHTGKLADRGGEHNRNAQRGAHAPRARIALAVMLP